MKYKPSVDLRLCDDPDLKLFRQLTLLLRTNGPVAHLRDKLKCHIMIPSSPACMEKSTNRQ